jgi:hypothetical protein
MTSPEAAVLRQRITRVIALRAGASTSGSVAEAARLAHADVAAVFAPLISSSGVEALLGRAFDLAQREYPTEERRGDGGTPAESLAQFSRWLERQAPSTAADAAAAMFATFAELLAALIGEPLTTRYLEKAWPGEFSGAEPKRKKT